MTAPSAPSGDLVDAALAMAASYSDELAGPPRQDYPRLAVGIPCNWGVRKR